MKRLLSALLVLVLCVAVLPAPSYAYKATVTDFTWETAKALISENGWEGVTGVIKEVGIRFWREGTMMSVEITEDLEKKGYLGMYVSEDVQLAVILQDYGMDMDDYKAAIEDSGYKNIREESVNGREFIIYDESRKKQNYRRIAATEEDGQILEFVYFYDTKSFDAITEVMIATIRDMETETK